VMFILLGKGRNGKSTFLDLLCTLLGDYAKRTPAETLMAKREGGIPNDVARLKGARFVCASETDEGRRLDEARIKDVTGGERITALRLHLRGRVCRPRPDFLLRWLDHRVQRPAWVLRGCWARRPPPRR